MPERNVKDRTGALKLGAKANDFALPRRGGDVVSLKEVAAKAL